MQRVPVHCTMKISRPFRGIEGSGACEFRSLMDLDVCMYPDIHACILAYWRWHELVGSHSYRFSRQFDRFDPDGSERSCRDAIWNPISGFVSRFVWDNGRQSARFTACACRMRLVRHSDLDWR